MSTIFGQMMTEMTNTDHLWTAGTVGTLSALGIGDYIANGVASYVPVNRTMGTAVTSAILAWTGGIVFKSAIKSMLM